MNGQALRRYSRVAAAGWLGVLICTATTANSATLSVAVTDRAGKPVSDAAIYAVPAHNARSNAAAPPAAVIDQREQTFVPHVLVVETGTAVEFPNHDTVHHHVYSFSDAKPFELPLYSGRAHAPIVFDTPGVVDIGCNIHDHMEAHIVIVDTPYFGVTSESDTVEIVDVPPGQYTVHVYTPRLSPRSQPAPRSIVIADSAVHIDISIDKRLRPAHGRTNRSLEWSAY